MSRTLFFSIGISQLAALTILAFSTDAIGRESISATRMEVRRDSVATYQGTLTCVTAETNDGRACRLLFQKAGSRQTLEVAGTKDRAMRLYLDGKRDVTIEGLITGGYLRIERIRAL